MKLIGGGVYRDNIGRLFVLVPLFWSKWGMLYVDRHYIKGMSAVNFQYDDSSPPNPAFTKKELKEKFNSDEWILLNGRLRIEKIDALSFVEYANGELSKYKIKE